MPSASPAPAPTALRVRALTPADEPLLRRFVAQEAVVPVQSAADLARRLAPDRRLLVVQDADGEPLCFVNVALMTRFPERLERVLSGPPEDAPPTFAVFYGITRVSTRARGQAGGLLHRAVAFLQEDVPSVTTFATLSPVPGLRAWVEDLLDRQGHAEATELVERIARQAAAGLLSAEKEAYLQRLARLYLSRTDLYGRPRDPVARFHLRNGAVLRDVLVGADGSMHGLQQSLGILASYAYPLDGQPQPDLPDPIDPTEAEEDLFRALLSSRGAA